VEAVQAHCSSSSSTAVYEVMMFVAVDLICPVSTKQSLVIQSTHMHTAAAITCKTAPLTQLQCGTDYSENEQIFARSITHLQRQTGWL
jgi:hypothetical protein